MLQRIEQTAQVSVARACGFAALAISLFMVGLSGDMVSSFKVGGILCLLASTVLLLKAWYAAHRPYKRTEVWLMLEPQDRPNSAIAQQIIGTVLRETFLYFALQAAFAAAVLLCGAVTCSLLFPAS
jgi:hypothetical protein